MISRCGQHGNVAEFVVRAGNWLRRESQFHVLLFHHARRSHQTQAASRKDWFRIAHAEGFESPQGLKQIVRDLIEWEFGIEIEDGFEVHKRQTRAGVPIKMCAQFWYVRSRHGETDGVRVSAKTGEQWGARFERV